MPICVVFVVITLVEATSFINRRTVALCVPMANRPSRLAAVTLAALGLASGAPINAVSRKPVNTAHSNPNTHASAARPRRSSMTARMVVVTAASRNTGIASSFVSAPCSFVTMAAAASTKLPVTCATNSPNSARTVKLSMKPAVKLKSGGTIAGGRGRRKTRTSFMIPPSRAPSRFEPRRDPLHRFAHLRGRARVAEADEVFALERIEIEPRRRRHMRLCQHALGELETVVAEARHVGIEIEGAVDREDFIEARFRQALEQNAAILLVAVLHRLHLRPSVERRLGRDLGQRRDRDGEIALQAIERTHERSRRHYPADAPAGHAEIFRE